MGAMKNNVVGEETTCEKCKQNCLLIHHHLTNNNNSLSSSSTPLFSFFKIMIGDNFTKFLHLPPKFSREVSNLVGQEVLLKDLNGRQWGVTISKIKGSAAFKQGWNDFTLDHDLKFGDFVVFHYVKGSHFIVQIFDTTGCAKPDYPEDKGHPKKRVKGDDNAVTQNGHCNMSDKSPMNVEGSSGTADMDMNCNHSDTSNVDKVRAGTGNTIKSPNGNGSPPPSAKIIKTDYMDDSYYMTINRDLASTQAEQRTPIYDLSSFEMCCDKAAADRRTEGITGKGTSYVPGDSLLQPLPQPEAVSSIKQRAVLIDQSERKPLDVPIFQKREENNGINDEPMKSPKYNDGSSKLLRQNMSGKMLDDVIKRCQVAGQRNSTSNGFTEPLFGNNQANLQQEIQISLPTRTSAPMPTPFRGEMPLKVKQERVEVAQEYYISEETFIGKEPLKAVKSEAIDTPYVMAPKSVSCLVASNDQSYLELPKGLPSYKGRMRSDEKVVMLRDSFMRLWPVLYHDLYGGKVLASGWETFRKANSIEPGDECVFELEDFVEGIFKVAITRRF